MEDRSDRQQEGRALSRLRSVSFPIERRGYDKRAVERFLDRVASDFEDYRQQVRARADASANTGGAGAGTPTAPDPAELAEKAQKWEQRAKAEAERIVGQARQSAEAGLGKAREKAKSMLIEAKRRAELELAAAEREAEEIRDKAKAEATEILDRARQEAAALGDAAQPEMQPAQAQMPLKPEQAIAITADLDPGEDGAGDLELEAQLDDEEIRARRASTAQSLAAELEAAERSVRIAIEHARDRLRVPEPGESPRPLIQPHD